MNTIIVRNFSPFPITEMYLAAKRCRNAGDVERFRDDPPETQERLVRDCLQAGHLAIAEAVNYTIDIQGLPKCNANQLVRHRLCSYWERSGRSVVIGSFEEATKAAELANDEQIEAAEQILRKYFFYPDCLTDRHLATGLTTTIALAFVTYHYLIRAGYPAEMARRVLPQGELVDITMRTNLRNLMEICKLRLCQKAELPIWDLFNRIRDAVRMGPDGEFIANLLKPKCEVNHRCDEKHTCGHWHDFTNQEQPE